MNKPRLFFMSLMALITIASKAQVTPACQMEKLDRGLVAVPTSTTANFVSWRLLGTDDKANTTFDLLRNGTVIAPGLTKTNYQDTQGSATAKYQVVTKVNGSAIENSAEVTPWGKKYLSLKLDRPKGGTISNWSNTDASTGPTTEMGVYPCSGQLSKSWSHWQHLH